MAVSANRLELLQIADAVAREKAIDRGIVIAAMEDAIAKAARSRYGAETEVHAEINPKTGELRLNRHMLVVDSVENPSNQIGLDEVRAVARDPGSRAKIAVISRDSSVDPVGACVGMRGSRVQAVVNELQGEKIDIIPWSPDIPTFVVNALAPAEVAKVVLDEDRERIEVVVPDQQLSLAIGRRGQNVRLASQLTGWDIDILTEQEESERRQKEFAERTEAFMNALDVDEVVGQLLASEGFRSVDELAYVEVSDIASIEGFDEDTAVEIQS